MGIFRDCGCGCGGAKQKKKFLISLLSACIFFIMASPEIFQVSRSLFHIGDHGLLLLHAFIYLLITWGLMNIGTKNQSEAL